jgi:hypothetical protein
METLQGPAHGWHTPTDAEKRDSVNRASARMKQRVTLSLAGHRAVPARCAPGGAPPGSVAIPGAVPAAKDSRGAVCPA